MSEKLVQYCGRMGNNQVQHKAGYRCHSFPLLDWQLVWQWTIQYVLQCSSLSIKLIYTIARCTLTYQCRQYQLGGVVSNSLPCLVNNTVISMMICIQPKFYNAHPSFYTVVSEQPDFFYLGIELQMQCITVMQHPAGTHGVSQIRMRDTVILRVFLRISVASLRTIIGILKAFCSFTPGEDCRSGFRYLHVGTTWDRSELVKRWQGYHTLVVFYNYTCRVQLPCPSSVYKVVESEARLPCEGKESVDHDILHVFWSKISVDRRVITQL